MGTIFDGRMMRKKTATITSFCLNVHAIFRVNSFLTQFAFNHVKRIRIFIIIIIIIIIIILISFLLLFYREDVLSTLTFTAMGTYRLKESPLIHSLLCSVFHCTIVY